MPAKTVVSSIHSRKKFQHLLQRERILSDRDDSELSMVLFHSSNGSIPAAKYEELIRTIDTRSRSADEVGWFSSKSIGVILPFTCQTGAKQFAAKVKNQLSGKTNGSLFAYSIYSRMPKVDPAKPLSLVKDNLTDCISEDLVHSAFVKKMPVWKRGMDIVGSIAGLLLSSPIFLILSLYIKIVSPGPIFYKQKRVGFKGKQFSFLKFRTMKTGNKVSSHQSHLKDLINSEKPMEKLDNTVDDRIIPGGRIIRKLSIDEVPQFINILKGEMSLVGPRPCIPYEAEEYLRWHTHRFDIVPGLTGLWQVSGKNKMTFKQMIRLDITYSENISLWRDIKIILFTIPTVIGLGIEGVVNRYRRRFNQSVRKE